jgi:hypothetical protein
MSRVALVILLATSAACDVPRKVPVRLQESTGELGQRLAVEVRSWRDPFGDTWDEDAIGLRVTLQNVSSQPLVGCSLGLAENRFQSPFDSLEVYRGFFGGNAPWGRPSLAAGEKVTFAFHHDNNNYIIVRADDGSLPSRTTAPGSIDVVCGDLRARWSTGG